METLNIKEEVRSLIDQMPENFTWDDLISAISLRQNLKSEPIQQEEKLKRMKDFLASMSDEDREEWKKIGDFLDRERAINRQISMLAYKRQQRYPLFGSDGGLITTSDDFDEPLELLPSPLVERLLEKAKELTKVSAELAEIIARIDRERDIDKPQNFWEAVQKFRQENNLEAAGIEPEVFEGVRDLSPGREVIL